MSFSLRYREREREGTVMRALKPSSLSSLILRAIRPGVVAAKPSGRPSLHSIHSQNGERDDSHISAIKGCCLSSIAETLLEYERDKPCDDRKVMDKEETLHFALSQIAGDFDRESNLSLRRFFGRRYAPVISTGSLKLDLALGIGGLPKGRMVEIYGKEASGKTTLALHIVKEAQSLGGCCAYLDAENAIVPSLVEAMGVNLKKLLIARPNSAENSLSIVDTLVNSGSVDVIVVDSVAALVPQCELDGVINIHSQDVQSRLMTQALRKIHCSLNRSQTLIIFVNQVRMDSRANQDFGQINEVTCGGNALKFYAAIRLRITRKDLLHSQDEITGINIAVQVMKNKLAPPMKKASMEIGFGRGFRREVEILEMASKHGIVSRERNGFWIKGEFFKDQQEAEQYLLENDGVSDELVDILRSQLFERS